MKDPVYKLIELTGTSTTSIETPLTRPFNAHTKTIKNLCWFQVVENTRQHRQGKGASLAGDHQSRFTVKAERVRAVGPPEHNQTQPGVKTGCQLKNIMTKETLHRIEHHP